MDFNSLIAELRASSENLPKDSADRSLLSSVYCNKACKVLDEVSESTDYDTIITGLWLVTAHFAEQLAYLKPVPALSELCFKLFRQCAKAVLNIQWQNLEDDSSLRQNFLASLANLHAKLVPFDFPRFRLLEGLTENPWTNPTLAKVMGGEVEDGDKEEVRTYIEQEDPIILQLRVDMMLQENCEEYALNLCNNCLSHPELQSDLGVRKMQLSLLYKLGQEDKLQEECQKLNIQDAVRIIKQLQTSETHRQICTVLAQTFMVQNWIRPSDMEANKELLRLWIRHQLLVDREQDQFKESVWAMAKLSQSTEQIVIFIDVLREECGEIFLQLYVDMCIFAINVDKGQMETNKKEGNMEAAAARRSDMASICAKLSCLCHHASIKVARICALTSFALKPTEQSFAKIGTFYGQGSDCCNKCGRDRNREPGTINPATLYEVERLLNMLRPDYLSPEQSYANIQLLCRRFLQESLKNAQQLQRQQMMAQNSGIPNLIDGPANKLTPAASRPKNVFEALSPQDYHNTQMLLNRMRIQSITHTKAPAPGPPGAQHRHKAGGSGVGQPGESASPSLPGRANKAQYMFDVEKIKSKQPYGVPVEQQHQYYLMKHEKELEQRRKNAQKKREGKTQQGMTSNSQMQQQVWQQQQNQQQEHSEQVGEMIQTGLQDSSTLQKLTQRASPDLVQAMINIMKGSMVKPAAGSDLPQQTGTQQMKPLVASPQPGTQPLPTVSTLLKPSVHTQQAQKQQNQGQLPAKEHHPREQSPPRRHPRPQLYAQPISVSSASSVAPRRYRPSSTVNRNNSSPITSATSPGEKQKGEGFVLAKSHVEDIRRFMQMQMSNLQHKQIAEPRQMSGSTVTLKNVSSANTSFGFTNRPKTTVEIAEQAALAKLQKRDSSKPGMFQPSQQLNSNSGQMFMSQPKQPLPKPSQQLQFTPSMDSIEHHQHPQHQQKLLQSHHQQVNTFSFQNSPSSNMVANPVLPSDELSGSIMGIDDTIIKELLQDSGILANTFPDIEVETISEDKSKYSMLPQSAMSPVSSQMPKSSNSQLYSYMHPPVSQSPYTAQDFPASQHSAQASSIITSSTQPQKAASASHQPSGRAVNKYSLLPTVPCSGTLSHSGLNAPPNPSISRLRNRGHGSQQSWADANPRENKSSLFNKEIKEELKPTVDQLREIMKKEDIEGEVCMDAANNATYRCIICSIAFESLDHLREHVRNVCKPGLQSSSVYNTKIKQDRANSAKAGVETTTVFQCLRCFELCVSDAGIKQHRLTCKRVPTVPSDLKKDSKQKVLSRSAITKPPQKKVPKDHSDLVPEPPLPSPYPSLNTEAVLKSMSLAGSFISQTSDSSIGSSRRQAEVSSSNSISKSTVATPAPLPTLSNTSAVVSAALSVSSSSTSCLMATSESQSSSFDENIVRQTPDCSTNITVSDASMEDPQMVPDNPDAPAEVVANSASVIERDLETRDTKPVTDKDPDAIPQPSFTEITGSGGSKFYKCGLCSQTLCSHESFLVHWKECAVKNKNLIKKLELKEKACSVKPISGEVLENLIRVIEDVAAGGGSIPETISLDSEFSDVSDYYCLRDPWKAGLLDMGDLSDYVDSDFWYDFANSDSQESMFESGADTGETGSATGSGFTDNMDASKDGENEHEKDTDEGMKEEDDEISNQAKRKHLEDTDNEGRSESDRSYVPTRKAPPKLRDRKTLKPIHSFINETFNSHILKTAVKLPNAGSDEKLKDETEAGTEKLISDSENESDGDSLYCKVCRTSFQTKRILLQHFAGKHLQPYTVKTVADSSSYFCHLCQKTYSTFMHYMQHVPNHAVTIYEKMKAFIASRRSQRSQRIAMQRGLAKKGNMSPKMAKALKSKKAATKSAVDRLKQQLLAGKTQAVRERLKISKRKRSLQSTFTSSEDDFSSDASNNVVFKSKKSESENREPTTTVRPKRSTNQPLHIENAGSLRSSFEQSEEESDDQGRRQAKKDLDDDYVLSEEIDSDSMESIAPPTTRSRKRIALGLGLLDLKTEKLVENSEPSEGRVDQNENSAGDGPKCLPDTHLADYDADSNCSDLLLSQCQNGHFVPSESKLETQGRSHETGSTAENVHAAESDKGLIPARTLIVRSLSKKLKERLKSCDLHPTVVLETLQLDVAVPLKPEVSCPVNTVSEQAQGSSNENFEHEPPQLDEPTLVKDSTCVPIKTKNSSFLDSFLSYLNQYPSHTAMLPSDSKTVQRGRKRCRSGPPRVRGFRKRRRSIDFSNLGERNQGHTNLRHSGSLQLVAPQHFSESEAGTHIDSSDSLQDSVLSILSKFPTRRCSVNLGQKLSIEELTANQNLFGGQRMAQDKPAISVTAFAGHMTDTDVIKTTDSSPSSSLPEEKHLPSLKRSVKMDVYATTSSVATDEIFMSATSEPKPVKRKKHDGSGAEDSDIALGKDHRQSRHFLACTDSGGTSLSAALPPHVSSQSTSQYSTTRFWSELPGSISSKLGTSKESSLQSCSFQSKFEESALKESQYFDMLETSRDTLLGSEIRSPEPRFSDIESSDLVSIDIESSDFVSIDIESSELVSTEIGSSDFVSIDIESSELVSTEIGSSDLVPLDIESSELVSTEIGSSDLVPIDIESSELVSTDIGSSDLVPIDIESSELVSTEIGSSDLVPIDIESSELVSTEIGSSDLVPIDIESSELVSTEIGSSDLVPIDIESSELVSTDIGSSDLVPIDIESSELVSTEIGSSDLVPIDIESSELVSTEIESSDHVSIDIESSELVSTEIGSSDLVPIDIESSEFVSTEIESSDHVSIDIESSELVSTGISSELEPSDLRSLDLRPLDIESSVHESTDVRYLNNGSADIRSLDTETADIRSLDTETADIRSLDTESADKGTSERRDFECQESSRQENTENNDFKSEKQSTDTDQNDFMTQRNEAINLNGDFSAEIAENMDDVFLDQAVQSSNSAHSSILTNETSVMVADMSDSGSVRCSVVSRASDVSREVAENVVIHLTEDIEVAGFDAAANCPIDVLCVGIDDCHSDGVVGDMKACGVHPTPAVEGESPDSSAVVREGASVGVQSCLGEIEQHSSGIASIDVGLPSPHLDLGEIEQCSSGIVSIDVDLPCQPLDLREIEQCSSGIVSTDVDLPSQPLDLGEIEQRSSGIVSTDVDLPSQPLDLGEIEQCSSGIVSTDVDLPSQPLEVLPELQGQSKAYDTNNDKLEKHSTHQDNSSFCDSEHIQVIQELEEEQKAVEAKNVEKLVTEEVTDSLEEEYAIKGAVRSLCDTCKSDDKLMGDITQYSDASLVVINDSNNMITCGEVDTNVTGKSSSVELDALESCSEPVVNSSEIMDSPTSENVITYDNGDTVTEKNDRANQEDAPRSCSVPVVKSSEIMDLPTSEKVIAYGNEDTVIGKDGSVEQENALESCSEPIIKSSEHMDSSTSESEDITLSITSYQGGGDTVLAVEVHENDQVCGEMPSAGNITKAASVTEGAADSEKDMKTPLLEDNNISIMNISPEEITVECTSHDICIDASRTSLAIDTCSPSIDRHAGSPIVVTTACDTSIPNSASSLKSCEESLESDSSKERKQHSHPRANFNSRISLAAFIAERLTKEDLEHMDSSTSESEDITLSITSGQGGGDTVLAVEVHENDQVCGEMPSAGDITKAASITKGAADSEKDMKTPLLEDNNISIMNISPEEITVECTSHDICIDASRTSLAIDTCSPSIDRRAGSPIVVTTACDTSIPNSASSLKSCEESLESDSSKERKQHSHPRANFNSSISLAAFIAERLTNEDLEPASVYRKHAYDRASFRVIDEDSPLDICSHRMVTAEVNCVGYTDIISPLSSYTGFKESKKATYVMPVDNDFSVSISHQIESPMSISCHEIEEITPTYTTSSDSPSKHVNPLDITADIDQSVKDHSIKEPVELTDISPTTSGLVGSHVIEPVRPACHETLDKPCELDVADNVKLTNVLYNSGLVDYSSSEDEEEISSNCDNYDKEPTAKHGNNKEGTRTKHDHCKDKTSAKCDHYREEESTICDNHAFVDDIISSKKSSKGGLRSDENNLTAESLITSRISDSHQVFQADNASDDYNKLWAGNQIKEVGTDKPALNASQSEASGLLDTTIGNNPGGNNSQETLKKQSSSRDIPVCVKTENWNQDIHRCVNNVNCQNTFPAASTQNNDSLALGTCCLETDLSQAGTDFTLQENYAEKRQHNSDSIDNVADDKAAYLSGESGGRCHCMCSVNDLHDTHESTPASSRMHDGHCQVVSRSEDSLIGPCGLNSSRGCEQCVVGTGQQLHSSGENTAVEEVISSLSKRSHTNIRNDTDKETRLTESEAPHRNKCKETVQRQVASITSHVIKDHLAEESVTCETTHCGLAKASLERDVSHVVPETAQRRSTNDMDIVKCAAHSSEGNVETNVCHLLPQGGYEVFRDNIHVNSFITQSQRNKGKPGEHDRLGTDGFQTVCSEQNVHVIEFDVSICQHDDVFEEVQQLLSPVCVDSGIVKDESASATNYATEVILSCDAPGCNSDVGSECESPLRTDRACTLLEPSVCEEKRQGVMRNAALLQTASSCQSSLENRLGSGSIPRPPSGMGNNMLLDTVDGSQGCFENSENMHLKQISGASAVEVSVQVFPKLAGSLAVAVAECEVALDAGVSEFKVVADKDKKITSVERICVRNLTSSGNVSRLCAEDTSCVEEPPSEAESGPLKKNVKISQCVKPVVKLALIDRGHNQLKEPSGITPSGMFFSSNGTAHVKQADCTTQSETSCYTGNNSEVGIGNKSDIIYQKTEHVNLDVPFEAGLRTVELDQLAATGNSDADKNTSNTVSRPDSPRGKTSIDHETDDGDDFSDFDLIIEKDTSCRSLVSFPIAVEKTSYSPVPKHSTSAYISKGKISYLPPSAKSCILPSNFTYSKMPAAVGNRSFQGQQVTGRKPLIAARTCRKSRGQFVWEVDDDNNSGNAPEPRVAVVALTSSFATGHTVSASEAASDPSLDTLRRKQKALREKSETAPFTWDLDDNADSSVSSSRSAIKVRRLTKTNSDVISFDKSGHGSMTMPGNKVHQQIIPHKRPLTPDVPPGKMPAKFRRTFSVDRQVKSSVRSTGKELKRRGDMLTNEVTNATSVKHLQKSTSGSITVDKDISFKKDRLSPRVLITPSRGGQISQTDNLLSASSLEVKAKRGERTQKQSNFPLPLDVLQDCRPENSGHVTEEGSPKNQLGLRSRHSSMESNKSDKSVNTKRAADMNSPLPSKRSRKSEEDTPSPKLKKIGLIKITKDSCSPPATTGSDSTAPMTRSSEAAIKAFHQKSLRSRGVNPCPLTALSSSPTPKHIPQTAHPKSSPETGSRLKSSVSLQKLAQPLTIRLRHCSAESKTESSPKSSARKLHDSNSVAEAVIKRRSPSSPVSSSNASHAKTPVALRSRKSVPEFSRHRQSTVSSSVFRVKPLPHITLTKVADKSHAAVSGRETKTLPSPPVSSAAKSKKDPSKHNWTISKDTKLSKGKRHMR